MARSNKELTDQQQAFLDALFGSCMGDINGALKEAGYKPTSKYTVMQSLREEIIERAEMLIAAHAPKATLRMLGILDDPTALGSKQIQDTAKEILDRAGIVKQDKVSVESDGATGIFILPAKQYEQE